MKEIWIIQTGEPMPSDIGQRPMRAINLARTLLKNGFKVKIITSRFFHQKKIHRTRSYKRNIERDIEEIYIDSPGYKKNLGLARIYDHIILALNLHRYLKTQSEKPNMIFVGYPPIEFSYIAINWAYKNNIPSIIDIKDQWPNLFYEDRPIIIKIIMKLIFLPYDLMAKKLIIRSSSITAPTESYIKWALKKTNMVRRISDRPFPLVSNALKVSKNNIKNVKNLDKLKKYFNILFVGSHMSVFDFKHVADAARILKLNQDIKFIICGDGDYFESNKYLFKNLNNTIFPGWVDLDTYREYASISSCSIAPYKNISNYRDNIPNKVTDYLHFGLPILWSLKGEVNDLISNYKCGLTYEYDSGTDLSNKILKLRNSSKLTGYYSENAISLYKSLFDKEKIYNNLVKHITKTISGL